jgi:CHAD domain-containing protein
MIRWSNADFRGRSAQSNRRSAQRKMQVAPMAHTPSPTTAGAPIPGIPNPLEPESRLWVWAFESIAARAGEMLMHTHGVRAGVDIEAVHDMRVGSRRLVAAMRVFGDCFPGRRYTVLFREARRVTGALGAVRDLDVLLDYFARLPGGDEGHYDLGIRYLSYSLNRDRDRARVPMLDALRRLEGSGYEQRLSRYLIRQVQKSSGAPRTKRSKRESAACPGEGSDPRSWTFRHAAPACLLPRLDALLAFEPYVDDPNAITELHDMRIAAKWLRYTMELFAPAFQDRLKRGIETVKRVQELLGDLHDSDVRLDLVRDTLRRPLRAAGICALGLLNPDPVTHSLRHLQAREEFARERDYRAFQREWHKLRRQQFAAACRERIQAPDAGGRDPGLGGEQR